MIVAVGGRDTRYETVENVRKTLTKPLTVGNHYYVGALVTLERSSKFLASTLYVDIIMHLSMYRLRLSVYARAPTHTYTHFTVEPPCSRTSHYTPPVGGRSSSDEQNRSACALTPTAFISRWPSYRVSAICRSPDSYHIPTHAVSFEPFGSPRF